VAAGSVIVSSEIGNGELFFACTMAETPEPWPTTAYSPLSRVKLWFVSGKKVFDAFSISVSGRTSLLAHTSVPAVTAPAASRAVGVAQFFTVTRSTGFCSAPVERMVSRNVTDRSTRPCVAEVGIFEPSAFEKTTRTPVMVPGSMPAGMAKAPAAVRVLPPTKASSPHAMVGSAQTNSSAVSAPDGNDTSVTPATSNRSNVPAPRSVTASSRTSAELDDALRMPSCTELAERDPATADAPVQALVATGLVTFGTETATVLLAVFGSAFSASTVAVFSSCAPSARVVSAGRVMRMSSVSFMPAVRPWPTGLSSAWR
jgi:hypothetical protein